jgi:asparagine synthase (glutamine-hydrolysing)
MCGIAGLVSWRERPDEELAVSMAEVLAHRGPDAAGRFGDARCALGVRRLAVQDVAHGHQPVYSEDRSVVAVFNGEIYNFRELRARLERGGHRLASRSDSEVIPHLYEEHGDRFVHELDGMFAIALWDSKNERLVLVRDRIGKKPLYYCRFGDCFRFASEIKAFFADRSVPREPDLQALHHYLVLQYVPAPQTAFVGISSLRPGEILVVDEHGTHAERYWRLEAAPDPSIDLDDAAALVRDALREAVARRMIADVPVGAFLSGGADSASVVATMAELSTDPVPTFTIVFDEHERDERVLAAVTARAFGTEHTEHLVRSDAAGLLPVLAWHYDQPLGDDTIVPYYALAREARRDVTVALGGEGGDEAFAGYSRFYEVLELERTEARQPGGESGLAGAYAASVEIFPEMLARSMYTPQMAEATRDVSSLALVRDVVPDSGDPLTRMLLADYAERMPGSQMPLVDITTMAVSLEARSPMLDHHFVTAAATLPAEVKVGPAGENKVVLRKAFRGIVPDEVLDAPKRPFLLPLERWFRSDLAPFARGLLTANSPVIRELVRPRAIAAMLDAHESGTADHSLAIMNLVCLELWLRTYVAHAPPLAPPSEVDVRDVA